MSMTMGMNSMPVIVTMYMLLVVSTTAMMMTNWYFNPMWNLSGKVAMLFGISKVSVDMVVIVVMVVVMMVMVCSVVGIVRQMHMCLNSATMWTLYREMLNAIFDKMNIAK